MKSVYAIHEEEILQYSVVEKRFLFTKKVVVMVKVRCFMYDTNGIESDHTFSKWREATMNEAKKLIKMNKKLKKNKKYQ